ncbi:MAG: hypothetical protein R3223_00815 [Longimicrobiales bacterium]|nr:hypothetical protein [Longimicrobiales bacterium]
MTFETIPDGWIALLALGAFHGVNPAMGWLFAVALGLQEGSGRAVWRALPPLLAGHALSVVAAILVGSLLGLAVGSGPVSWLLAGTLVLMGLLHMRRAWHPRFGGMKVGARDLVVWSFLMATAHGAGLMALAFVPLGTGAEVEIVHAAVESVSGAPIGAAGHLHGATGAPGWRAGVGAAFVHTLGYLAATGLLASLVYYRLGLRQLQRRWVNVDLVWAASLVITGLALLVL